MRSTVGGVVLATMFAACADHPYDPHIDPDDFIDKVNNLYFPLLPGTIFQYEVQETGETVIVTVTEDRKEIMGVSCMVVHDEAMSGGVLVEDTYDYYAQDKDRTVWYFGEDTTAFEDGGSTTEGSWLAGVDGGLPGILIPGMPKVGDTYRQEYLRGEAEDQGEVLATDAVVTVPYAFFIGCLQTRDFSNVESGEENKYYCPSIGLVRSIATQGDPETEDLVTLTRP